jgi:hypothetical protein
MWTWCSPKGKLRWTSMAWISVLSDMVLLVVRVRTSYPALILGMITPILPGAPPPAIRPQADFR